MDSSTPEYYAWLKTLEDGIHTYDVYKEGISTRKVGTAEFADAVIDNLGKFPTQLQQVSYSQSGKINLPKYQRAAQRKKELVGVDIFVHWNGTDPDLLASEMKKIANTDAELTMITNRGIKVWPDGFQETFCTDHWRCRFKPKNNLVLGKEVVIQLLNSALSHQIDTIKTENLYSFDGVSAYSLGQGQKKIYGHTTYQRHF